MMISTTFRNKASIKILRVIIPLAFWLGVWQLAALLVGKQLLLPGPAAVSRRLLALAGEGAFWRAVAISMSRILAGFAAGALLGTVLAALSAASRWADWLVSPAVKIIRAAPVASFIVLVLLWAPTGRVPAIISALMVLPVLWGNVRRGIAQTDPLLLEAARAYRFGRRKTLWLVYVPSAAPYFSSGCSTGLGLAWKAGVAAEVLCQPRMAIGTALYGAKITLETPTLFAWTLVVIGLSFLMEYALGFLLHRLGRRTET